MSDRSDVSRAPERPDGTGTGARRVTPDLSGRPVLISKVRLVGSLGGLVTVEWVLVAGPDRAWIEAFGRSPAKRRGTPAFVTGGCGQPRVHEGSTIRWSVPHEDLSGAAAYVLESVVYANSRQRTDTSPGPPPDGTPG